MSLPSGSAPAVVDRTTLNRLVPILEQRGYQVLGPVLRDGAIVYDTLKSLDGLPAGWTDEQAPGQYRLQQTATPALFAYAVGPQSWKQFLHPPATRLFQIERKNGGWRILDEPRPAAKHAFVGVRACELAAMQAQDEALTNGEFADATYRARREGTLLIAVNCTRPAATCFCASMGTGPRAQGGFDLALTEILEDGSHLFVMEAGSSTGAEILREIEARPAPPDLCRRAAETVERAASQTRAIDTTGIHDLLTANLDHPRWDHVAARCLTCGNCTMVCPTCFCTTVEDTTDVSGAHAERWRRWDSCFSQAFSYIHGGSVRKSARSRYRQWLTHKLAFWSDQFGGHGCVGCGRCITWCPAGIDITEEIRAIRELAPVTQSREDDDGNT